MGEAARPAKALLVVEDNDVEREGLARLLRQAGFDCREAATGTQALEALRAEAPHLILLDMLLPETDGWQLLKLIRLNPAWADIPVIIVTGLSIASREWSQSLGAVDVFLKPLDV